MFGRKRKFDRALRERGVPPTVESHHDDDERPLTTGPYDVRDAPEDDVPRLDLGALRIPTPEGFELQLQMTPAGQLSAVGLRQGDTDMQIGVFAAPRATGIWDDVRAEIAGELERVGATTTEEETDLGVELGSVQKISGVTYTKRFFGVDGPRWFLRALLDGPKAADPDTVEAFRTVLRDVVVDRGTEPRPVREPLTLTLPAELAEQAAQVAAAQQAAPQGEG